MLKTKMYTDLYDFYSKNYKSYMLCMRYRLYWQSLSDEPCQFSSSDMLLPLDHLPDYYAADLRMLLGMESLPLTESSNLDYQYVWHIVGDEVQVQRILGWFKQRVSKPFRDKNGNMYLTPMKLEEHVRYRCGRVFITFADGMMHVTHGVDPSVQDFEVDPITMMYEILRYMGIFKVVSWSMSIPTLKGLTSWINHLKGSYSDIKLMKYLLAKMSDGTVLRYPCKEIINIYRPSKAGKQHHILIALKPGSVKNLKVWCQKNASRLLESVEYIYKYVWFVDGGIAPLDAYEVVNLHIIDENMLRLELELK